MAAPTSNPSKPEGGAISGFAAKPDEKKTNLFGGGSSGESKVTSFIKPPQPEEGKKTE